MINFDELLLQLKQDPFFGYPTQGQRDNNTDQPLITVTHNLVSAFFEKSASIKQAQQFKEEYSHQYFSNDAHLELLILWCSFSKLPIYLNKEQLDWNWREFLKHDYQGIYFNKDELKDFLHNQQLPLPAYFFFDEPDNTNNTDAVNIAWNKIVSDKDLDKMPNGKERRTQAWQDRLSVLSKMPAHQDKTHEDLCKLIAKEPLGEGKSYGTIKRLTKSPFVK